MYLNDLCCDAIVQYDANQLHTICSVTGCDALLFSRKVAKGFVQYQWLIVGAGAEKLKPFGVQVSEEPGYKDRVFLLLFTHQKVRQHG